MMAVYSGNLVIYMLNYALEFRGITNAKISWEQNYETLDFFVKAAR